jgi:phosphoribosylformylglycinamidine (FGAM) synthase-like amidotransferase family enzyme
MQTQIIPREEWATFFADFSRQHEGRPVTLEVSPSLKVFTAKIRDEVEA